MSAGPSLRAGDTIELDVTQPASGGACVAREPGGQVVFVRHALPGERVRARVTGVTASYARADAVEILAASPDRVPAPCRYARPGGCGGCDWQHATPAAQRRLKAEVISEQLRRIARIDREVTVEPLPGGGDDGLGWRTRVRYSVAGDGTAGLLRHRSHDVVPVGTCLIAHPLVRGAGVLERRWQGTASVEVVASPATGQRVVLARGARGRPATREGPAHLRLTAAGRSWRVGAGSFWQVHPAAAGVLAQAVLGALAPVPGDTALDLYCGAGLFGGVLAPAVGPAGSVVCAESSRGAVRDARHNLRQYPWARVHAGDAAAVLARGGWPAPGLAVLDPPRTGAGKLVISRLLRPAEGQGSLRRVAYVSCDPATLARDVTLFAGYGWRLESLRAFDAFPMTHHAECLAVLVPG